MSLLLQILAVAAVVSTLPTILAARHAVRRTTLTTAWKWSLAVTAAWLVGTFLGLPLRGGNSAIAGQLWYAITVLSLCPPVAVLGAKRPGSRVWNFFVLVPLLFVLGSPAITGWNFSTFEATPLFLETPWLIGHGLVIVMGLGNYLGTRYTLTALLYGAALALLLTAFRFGWGKTESMRWTAILVMSAAVWAARTAAGRSTVASGFDRVWNDFRDQFGIVWARRIQDRLNDSARRENWPCRLELNGFHWNEDCDPAAREKALPQVEHALRWILRRFVDPEWIDERLGAEQTVG